MTHSVKLSWRYEAETLYRTASSASSQASHHLYYTTLIITAMCLRQRHDVKFMTSCVIESTCSTEAYDGPRLKNSTATTRADDKTKTVQAHDVDDRYILLGTPDRCKRAKDPVTIAGRVHRKRITSTRSPSQRQDSSDVLVLATQVPTDPMVTGRQVETRIT